MSVNRKKREKFDTQYNEFARSPLPIFRITIAIDAWCYDDVHKLVIKSIEYHIHEQPTNIISSQD